MSETSQRYLMEAQNRLHRKYGPGMSDLHRSLRRETRALKRKRLGQDPTDSDGTETQETPGGTITVTEPTTCLIGLAVGLQLNSDTFGACATTAIDQVDVLRQYMKDLRGVFKSGAYYTVLVYNLVGLGKSFIAGYE